MPSPVYPAVMIFSSCRVVFPFILDLAVLLCICGVAWCPSVGAQTSNDGASNMAGVNDVTGGMKHLLWWCANNRDSRGPNCYR
jgi:hypothetical protein